MDRVHLHARVGQEVVHDEHEAGRGPPTRAGGARRPSARAEVPSPSRIGDAEHDQDRARDQGADDEARARETRDALTFLATRPRPPSSRRSTITRAVYTPLEARSGLMTYARVLATKREQARVVEDRHRELAPDREEPHRLRDASRDPVVDTARPAGGELGRDQRRSGSGTRSPARCRGRRTRGRRRPSSAPRGGWPPSWWSSSPGRSTRSRPSWASSPGRPPRGPVPAGTSIALVGSGLQVAYGDLGGIAAGRC